MVPDEDPDAGGLGGDHELEPGRDVVGDRLLDEDVDTGRRARHPDRRVQPGRHRDDRAIDPLVGEQLLVVGVPGRTQLGRQVGCLRCRVGDGNQPGLRLGRDQSCVQPADDPGPDDGDADGSRHAVPSTTARC